MKAKQQEIATLKYIHPAALVDPGALIGEGTRVWAFAHVLPGAQVGENCNICDHTFIEGKVRLGNRVTVKCGVYLWDGVVVEDDVFIGPNATFTNDPRPRSQQHLGVYPTLRLKEGCSIGANSTLLPGVTIGSWAMVGAASVVTRDVADYALVTGNPARFKGWLCRCGEKLPTFVNARSECTCGRRYSMETETRIQELLQ